MSPTPMEPTSADEAAPLAVDVSAATAALRARWETIGVSETELVVDSGGTIAPASLSTAPREQLFAEALDALPDAEPEGGPGALVEVGVELGRGGMGVVREGVQRSLQRGVAVKSLRSDRESDEALWALLREAWITGQLEHPGIVPVHALYRSERYPLIVMKRIEGTSWAEELRNQRTDATQDTPDGAVGELSQQLRVLMQVCHAVHFAHSRGFVHLDLKPANVMIGGFGEVYLVDWGVAASLNDDAPAWVTAAKDLRCVVGTPAYLAPEQASGDGTRIDERTDVYLLGAILHELLTGKPPHTSQSMLASLCHAYRGEPYDYAPSLPGELTDLCHRAMAPERADRVQSAEAFRLALQEYLVHVESYRLSTEARERLASLETRLEGDAPLDEAGLQQLFNEAHFAFRQALRVWEDNADARAGLQTLLERMIQHALELRRLDTAASLVSSLPEARPELEKRVAALREELADADARAEEARRFVDEADLSRASRNRMLFSLLGGHGWLLCNAGLGYGERRGWVAPGFGTMVAVTLVGLVLYWLMVFGWRQRLLSNAANRRVIYAIGSAWLVVLGYWLAAWNLGVDFHRALILTGSLYATLLAFLAALADRRLLWAAAIPFVCTPVASFYPQYAFELVGLAGYGVFLAIGIAWRTGRGWRPPGMNAPA